jgi:hypothetical protein
VTSFFARMADRATGRAPVLRVRPPQPFERLQTGRRWTGVAELATGADDSEFLDIISDALDPAPPRARRPAGKRAGQKSAGSPATQDAVARTAPGERPTPDSPPKPPAATERERPEARPPLGGTRRTPPPPAPSPSTRRPRRETSSADPKPHTPARPPTQPVPKAADPPRLAGQVPRDRPRPDVPEPPAVDIVDLLRTHVLPTLVSRGLLSSRDNVDVVTEAPRRPGDDRASPPAQVRRAGAPESSTVTVTASPARRTVDRPASHPPTSQPDPQRRAAAAAQPSTPSGPLQVHVHIDRVVVARPAPAPHPAEPAPPQRPRPQADHDAYLARRRESR